MFDGLILVLAGGALWALLGIVTACGKKHNAPSELVQPFAGMLILAFAGWSWFLQEPFRWDGGGLALFSTIAFVGLCNYFTFNFIQRGMRSGREGVVWAFSQSAMICPFILGIVFFHEPAGLFRIIGIVAILSALALFSLERDDDSGGRGGWFGPTLAAFVFAGLAQCGASLPSYFQIPGVTPLRRMLILQMGIIATFLLDHRFRRKAIGFANRNAWLFAAVFGAANLIALILFYSGQNLLAEAKSAFISYPAAQGMSIALVFLYGCVKKTPSPAAWAAFALLMGGIVCLAL